METVAAAWLLKQHLQELKVRVINIVNLITLPPVAHHPHGLNENDFSETFTDTTEIVFAFYGYVSIIHDLVHERPGLTAFM